MHCHSQFMHMKSPEILPLFAITWHIYGIWISYICTCKINSPTTCSRFLFFMWYSFKWKEL